MNAVVGVFVQVKDDYMSLVAAACVLVASKQGERPGQIPTEQQLESVTGLQVLLCPALPCHFIAVVKLCLHQNTMANSVCC